jgi:hypothetical protein
MAPPYLIEEDLFYTEDGAGERADAARPSPARLAGDRLSRRWGESPTEGRNRGPEGRFEMSEIIVVHPGGVHLDEIIAVSLTCRERGVLPVERRNPTEAEIADPEVWAVKSNAAVAAAREGRSGD